MSAEHLIISAENHQIDLIGPVSPDSSWQARAQAGFDITSFGIDWEAQRVTCPAGQTSHSWRSRAPDRGHALIEVRFDSADCRGCASRLACTQSPDGPRMLKLKHRAEHEALQTARQRQTTPQFKERYKARAGIEGTLSQGTRAFDLRRSRYIGLAKTRLQHVATAAAINLTRVVSWLHGIPKARTRVSHFAALAVSG